MKFGLLIISFFLLLNGGCGNQKKVVHEVAKDWSVSSVTALFKEEENGDYFVGLASFAQYWVLECNTKNIEKILSVLEYSLKTKNEIKLATETSVYGILIVDAEKIEDGN